MRVHFASITIPERAAKRLKRLLDIPDSKARQWTAYVLGYANWHELHGAIGSQEPSPTDEQLAGRDLTTRLRPQLDRLSECLAAETPARDALEVLKAWRPSAARPQETHALSVGHRAAASRILVSTLKEVVDHHIPMSRVLDRVLAGVQGCEDVAFLDIAANIAVESLQSPVPAEQHAGRQVLEAMSSKEVPGAWLNLSMALMRGDGGDVDQKRGMDLLERVANCPTAPADFRSRARSLVGAGLAKGMGGRHADTDKALQVLVKAADEGDGEAGFNAGLLLQQSGQMEAAIKYYRRGAELGHVHAMTNLGIALLFEQPLAHHKVEAVEWLRKAAAHGDHHAAELVSDLDSKTP